jgi:hypothetical protein
MNKSELCREESMSRRLQLAIAIAGFVVLATVPTSSVAAQAGHCFRIERATAFSPRGEVYVDVAVTCGDRDFDSRDSLGVYVELLLSDRPALSEEVRVYSDDQKGRRTVVFDDLELLAGDPVLIRLVRFGNILDLKSVVAQ